MRILFTQDTDWPRRNPGQQHHLAELMQLKGHEVRVMDFGVLWRTDGRSGLWSRRESLVAPPKAHGDRGITVIRPGFLRLPVLDYVSYASTHWRELRRQLDSFRPDVVVTFGAVCAALAVHEARRRGTPLVHYWIDVTSLLLPEAFLKPLCAMLEKYAVRRASLVLTINEVFRDFVIRWGADPLRTSVVRAGIDGALFDPTAHRKHEARNRLGLAEDSLVLFFMGWLYNFSGMAEVTRDVLASTDERVRLIVVGEGDLSGVLSRLVSGSPNAHRVRLLGQMPHSQLPAVIAAADVCLLPAYRDEPIMQSIVPIKLYEYMAMGKPVIATRLPGVKREFGEDNGMVYVDGPEGVVATARALHETGAMQSLGVLARRHVEENTWERIAEQFEHELEALLKEESR